VGLWDLYPSSQYPTKHFCPDNSLYSKKAKQRTDIIEIHLSQHLLNSLKESDLIE
jgi:hypothetical protein